LSIRYIAIELYKAIHKVEALENRLKHAGPRERGELEARLFVARKERDALKKVLEAKKE